MSVVLSETAFATHLGAARALCESARAMGDDAQASEALRLQRAVLFDEPLRLYAAEQPATFEGEPLSCPAVMLAAASWLNDRWWEQRRSEEARRVVDSFIHAVLYPERTGVPLAQRSCTASLDFSRIGWAP